MNKALYDRDFLEWTQQQVNYLQKEHWAELDVKNLVEELEALGRSEQRELGSYLQALLMHLLKCQYQPERRTQSWDKTLSNCRDQIQDSLEDTPSLRQLLQDSEWVEKYYRRAPQRCCKGNAKAAGSISLCLSVYHRSDSRFKFLNLIPSRFGEIAMTDRRTITNQVQTLTSDRVKALVLDWLSETSGSLDDFEHLLEDEFRSPNAAALNAAALEYGQIDEALTFQPMTELEMVESSLQVLEDYKKTGNGVSHEQVRKWLDSLGTDHLRP